MNIDITIFNKYNVVDTCAIWNAISSKIFFSITLQSNVELNITNYVEYEALIKPRKNVKDNETELKNRLEKEIRCNTIKIYSISIEDLQDIDIFNNRNRFGKGEISSIVLAKKTRLCFMTDDQKARSLGVNILGSTNVQTTPHLLGWLFFEGFCIDSDLEQIIKEHAYFERRLEKYFRDVYTEALRCRLLLKNDIN